MIITSLWPTTVFTEKQPMAYHPVRGVARAHQRLFAHNAFSICCVRVPSARPAPANVNLLARLLVHLLDTRDCERAPRLALKLSISSCSRDSLAVHIVDMIRAAGILSRALPVCLINV